ncbi:MAG: hypothetical protein ABIQ16_10395 [Polyangiaceae bacterium]
MSLSSFVLFSTGALAGVLSLRSLAGWSEPSSLRSGARVIGSAVLGGAALVAVQLGAGAPLRLRLLPLALFSLLAVLSVAFGAARMDAAVAERQSARAVRRASGILSGAFLGMLAIGALTLALASTEANLGRPAWSHVLPLLASVLVAFAARTRLAGAGALALGQRGLWRGVLGLAALVVGRYALVPRPLAPAPREAAARVAPSEVALGAPALPSSVADAAPSADSAPPSVVPAPETSPPTAPSAAPATAEGPGEIVQIEALELHGMPGLDARGGVMRRIKKLEACVNSDSTKASGSITFKVGIDDQGGVTYLKNIGGDLEHTPVASCLSLAFYKMGFAPPLSGSATIKITLRVAPR